MAEAEDLFKEIRAIDEERAAAIRAAHKQG
jgi:hypothetical protein